MDMSAADPYEQQLRALFESFDTDNVGSLNQRGLQQLCEQLPLDHSQSVDLLSTLSLNDLARVSFSEFWDALLALLGGAKSSPSTQVPPADKVRHIVFDREESPEREVSPKLVLGQKKYGRRSRPESTELEFDTNELDPLQIDLPEEKNSPVASLSVSMDGNDGDRSNGLKKRRTTDIPDNRTRDSQNTSVYGFSANNYQGSLSQAEDCLKVAWGQYGKNGLVSQSELEQVCECIGIEKLSNEALQQLFEQLDTDRDGKVSLDDFLLLFRSGVPCAPMVPSTVQGSWVLGGSTIVGSAGLSLTDSNGVGTASTEAIIEMWDSVGIPNPSLLLRDLNLDDSLRSLNVTSVACALEEEVARQGKAGSVSDDSTLPSTRGSGVYTSNLLLAALTLRQAEVKWVKSSLEQMSCERDKLRNDLAEANCRASLLAQEIDDHHSKLEKVSKNQFKQLEQKHSEAIRELTARFSLEREQLVQQNNRLEQKVDVLQQSESKLVTEAVSLRQENETLDQESRNLAERVAECEEAKLQMEKELQEVDILQQRLSELQANQDQDRMEHLCEQINKLRAENSCLRDRNDELTVELEVLSTRLSNIRVRRPAPSSVDGSLKRRGNSPLAVAPTDDSGDEESPRVGKVRRCSQKGEISLDNVHIEELQIHPLGASEPGVEPDIDLDGSENVPGSTIAKLSGSKLHLESGKWLNLNSESSSLLGSQDDLISLVDCDVRTTMEQNVDVARLYARIEELERALHLHSSNFGGSDVKPNDLQDLKAIETDSVYLSEEDTPTSSLNVLKVPSTCEEDAPSNPSTLSLPAGDIPATANPAVKQLQQHCRDLETQLDNVKVQIVKILSEKRACSEENCILKKRISDLRNQLPDSGTDVDTPPSTADADTSRIIGSEGFFAQEYVTLNGVQVDKSVGTSDNIENNNDLIQEKDIKILEVLQASELEVSSLRDRCSDLEKSLSLMRDEYERCEDYWAGKLDEERQLAEQEQQITDEKFSELMSKIREYEDLFADDHLRRSSKLMDDRLETIEEQDCLERQVTQLEEELEDFRCRAEAKLVEKDNEILKLHEQLELLKNYPSPQNVSSADIAVQVSDLETESWGSDRTFVVKPRNIMNETGPPLQAFNGSSTDNVLSSTPSSSSSCGSPGCSEEDTRGSRPGAVRNHQPHGRHRRIRHHPPYIALNCLNPEDELQAVGLRLREQEQTCVRLQRAMRAQQQQTQALLQHTWDRHKQEIADLQIILQCSQEKLDQQGDICRDQINRLMRSDILVKELYVENAHLLASVQNLEERCLLLLRQQAGLTSASADNCSSV